MLTFMERKTTVADVFAEMEADAVDASVIPSDKKLQGIAGIAQKQLELENQVAKVEDHLKELKLKLKDVQTRELPNALTELGLSQIKQFEGLRADELAEVGITLEQAESVINAVSQYIKGN